MLTAAKQNLNRICPFQPALQLFVLRLPLHSVDSRIHSSDQMSVPVIPSGGHERTSIDTVSILIWQNEVQWLSVAALVTICLLAVPFFGESVF